MSIKRKTTEQFIREANLIHNYKYDYSKVEYINHLTKIEIVCKGHGSFFQRPSSHLQGDGCYECGLVHKALILTNKVFSNKEIDLYLLNAKLFIKRISNSEENKNIRWLCENCKYEWVSTFRGIKSGFLCPNCRDHSEDNMRVDNFLLTENLPIQRIGDYLNSMTKIEWLCLVCKNIWTTPPSQIMGKEEHRTGCPNCIRKNEKITLEVLNELSIKARKIYFYINDRMYRPDFYIPFLNMFIEYNGSQHYEPVRFGSITQEQAEENFKKQQTRDQELRNFCNINNIELLEIDGRNYRGNKLRNFIKNFFIEKYFGVAL